MIHAARKRTRGTHSRERKLRHHCNISQLIYEKHVTSLDRWRQRRRQQPRNFTFLFFISFFFFLVFLGSAGALSRRPLALYKALRIWGPRKIAINSINIALQFEIYSFIDRVQAAQHINSILMCTTFLFIPRIWPQLRSLLGMRISCESLGHSLYNEVMQLLFYIMHYFIIIIFTILIIKIITFIVRSNSKQLAFPTRGPMWPWVVCVALTKEKNID